MNEFQAKLCTFLIKDKKKRDFVRKLVMDKKYYNEIDAKLKESKVKEVKICNHASCRYERLEARKKEIGSRAALDEYLSSYLEPVRKAVQEELQNVKEVSEPTNSPMFTMWLQDNPPELVQMCLDSIKRFYPDIIIITEKNVSDYIDVPNYMWGKYKDGILSATQFSDYVRSALLDKYGGIWIDSTYYMLAPIPQFINKIQYFVMKNQDNNMISSNFLKFEKNNYIIKTMRIFMEQYWKKEDVLIDYFLFHLYFMLLTRKDSQCIEMWNKIPYCLNTNPLYIYKMFSQDFDEDVLKYVRQTSFMYKLTYKDKNAENNPNSWYWYLINQWKKGILLTSALENAPSE